MDCRIKECIEIKFRILIFLLPIYYTFCLSQTQLNYSYALHDPWGIRIYTLRNGLKVFLCPDSITNEIAGMLVVKAGSAQDPDHATGLAHYLEHMLFKGTQTLGTVNFDKEKTYLDKIKYLFEQHRQENDPIKAKKIYRKIDSLSYLASKYSIPNEYDKLIQLLGSKEYNAFTSNDATVYYTVFPSNQLEKWLLIEAERFKNPVFRLFHTELEAVYEEKNITLSSDYERYWNTVSSRLFAPTPYSYKTTIGTVEHLKKPSIIEIENYFKKFYVANNMALILCGNFNPDRAIVLIENLFSSLTAAEIKEEKWPKLDSVKRPYELITIKGKEKESVSFCWHAPVRKDNDYEIIKVLNEILYSDQKGLLYDKFVRSGYAIDVQVNYESLVKHALFEITFQPGSLNAQQIHDTLIVFLNSLQPNHIKKKDIKNIINNIKFDFSFLEDQPLSKAMLLQELFIHSISWQEYLNRMKSYDTISPYHVFNVFKKYFQNKPYLMVHKIKTDSIAYPNIEKPQITPIQGRINAQSTFYKKILSIPVPSLSIPKYTLGKSYFFSIIGKTSFFSCSNTKKNITEIKLIYHNTNFDAYKDFIPILFQNACPTHSTLEQTKDFMSENCFHMNAKFTSLGLEINIDFLNENKIEVFDFLNKFLYYGKIEESSYNRILNEYHNKYYELSSENQFHKLSHYALRSIGVLGEKKIKPEVLSNIKPDTFNLLFQNLSKPDAVLFAGNLSDTIFIKKICNNHESPFKIEFSSNNVRRDTNFVFHTTNPQSLIRIYSLIPLKKNIKDLYPQFVLFNNFMPFVMYKRIRENKGLAYSTTGQIKHYINKKTLHFYQDFFIGTQCDKTCDALKEFKSIIQNFPLSPQEFENNKKSYINNFIANSLKNLELMNTLYFNKILSITPEEFNSLPEKINKITYTDAMNFYKKYISHSAKVCAILTDPNTKYKKCLKENATKLLDSNELN